MVHFQISLIKFGFHCFSGFSPLFDPAFRDLEATPVTRKLKINYYGVIKCSRNANGWQKRTINNTGIPFSQHHFFVRFHYFPGFSQLFDPQNRAVGVCPTTRSRKFSWYVVLVSLHLLFGSVTSPEQ